MDSGAVVKALKTKFALVAANGQGEMQGKIFRVAHLGFFDYLDTVALLGAMEHIAKDTLGLPVEVRPGRGRGAGSVRESSEVVSDRSQSVRGWSSPTAPSTSSTPTDDLRFADARHCRCEL